MDRKLTTIKEFFEFERFILFHSSSLTIVRYKNKEFHVLFTYYERGNPKNEQNLQKLLLIRLRMAQSNFLTDLDQRENAKQFFSNKK